VKIKHRICKTKLGWFVKQEKKLRTDVAVLQFAKVNENHKFNGY